MVTTASKTYREICYDFVGGTNTDKFTSAGAVGMTFDASTATGATVDVGANGDEGRFDFGDNLTLDIDDLISVEFLAKITNWNDDVQAYLGVASAWNADFNAIAEHCFFILGDAAAPAVAGKWDIELHSDDGTNDVSFGTGYTIANNEWKRFCLNFKTGVQTKQPPTKSTGGKSNIKHTLTDNRLGYSVTTPAPPSLLDMSNYAGGLQLMFGAQQAAGAGVNAVLHVREVKVAYEQLS